MSVTSIVSPAAAAVNQNVSSVPTSEADVAARLTAIATSRNRTFAELAQAARELCATHPDRAIVVTVAERLAAQEAADDRQALVEYRHAIAAAERHVGVPPRYCRQCKRSDCGHLYPKGR